MASATIFFGTNRNVISEKPAKFGNGFDSEAPYFFRVGEVEVEKIGHPWKNADAAYRCGQPVLYPQKPADPAKNKGEMLGSTKLFDTLRKTMREDPRDVLVHLHGFANSFESAMERAAELRDAYLSPPTEAGTGLLATRSRMPLVFSFSWPSDGVTLGKAQGADPEKRKWAYSSDREDAKASGHAMARCAMRLFDYLAKLMVEERCGQRLHLVAHSMGNWALRNAVQALGEIAAQNGERLRMVFENAFLMCSDIEDDTLEDPAGLGPLLDLSRRVHVYHAGNDSALSASQVKPNQGARLGHFGPRNMSVLPDRVFAMDCTGVSYSPADGEVRHQYYRLAPEVVQDVRGVLAGKGADEMPWRAPGDGKNRYRIRLDDPARKVLRKLK